MSDRLLRDPVTGEPSPCPSYIDMEIIALLKETESPPNWMELMPRCIEGLIWIIQRWCNHLYLTDIIVHRGVQEAKALLLEYYKENNPELFRRKKYEGWFEEEATDAE